MGFNGSNGSTDFIDESGAAHGAPSGNGNAHVDTTNPIFGTGSMLCDGLGDGLVYAGDPDFQLCNAAGQAFTIECWIRANSTVMANQALCVCVQDYYFWLRSVGNGEVTLEASTTPNAFDWAITTSSGLTWVVGQAYHIACDRDVNNFVRVYRDGVMLAKTTNALAMSNASSLGIAITQNLGSSLNGWMDELRITKGFARYGSDGGYVVPTAAFPRGPESGPARPNVLVGGSFDSAVQEVESIGY